MSDFNSPREYIINRYIKGKNRKMTEKEFIKEFNQGLAEAKLEDYQNEGLVQTGNETVAEQFRPESQKSVSKYTIAVIKINGINYIRKRDIDTGRFVK